MFKLGSCSVMQENCIKYPDGSFRLVMSYVLNFFKNFERERERGRREMKGGEGEGEGEGERRRRRDKEGGEEEG